MESLHEPLGWNKLMDRARYALAHPEEVPPQDILKKCSASLRLWHYPAFRPSVSWTLFSTPDKTVMRLREITWDSVHDWQRKSNPLVGLKYGFDAVPTLSIRDNSVPSEATSQIFDGKLMISLQPAVSRPIHLDDETHGIEMPFSYPAFKLEWWRDGQAEWQDAVKWATRVREAFEQLLEANRA